VIEEIVRTRDYVLSSHGWFLTGPEAAEARLPIDLAPPRFISGQRSKCVMSSFGLPHSTIRFRTAAGTTTGQYRKL
jgi:hypothetical protein